MYRNNVRIIQIEIIELMVDAWPDVDGIYKWVVNIYLYAL